MADEQTAKKIVVLDDGRGALSDLIRTIRDECAECDTVDICLRLCAEPKPAR